MLVDLDACILRSRSERSQIALQVVELRVSHLLHRPGTVFQFLGQLIPLRDAFLVCLVQTHHQVVQCVHMSFAADGCKGSVPLLVCHSLHRLVDRLEGRFQSDEVSFRVKCRDAQALHHLSGLPRSSGQVVHDGIERSSGFRSFDTTVCQYAQSRCRFGQRNTEIVHRAAHAEVCFHQLLRCLVGLVLCFRRHVHVVGKPLAVFTDLYSESRHGVRDQV